MSRFYRAPDATYIDFIIEPDWKLAEKALQAKQKEYDSALATISMLQDKFQFDHINEEVENQKAQLVADYYNSKAEEIANYIRNTGDWRKVIPEIKKLRLEFANDYKRGKIAKFIKSYENYKSYLNEIERAKKDGDDYTLQQSIFSRKFEDWLKNPNRSLDNPFEFEQALKKPKELDVDNVVDFIKNLPEYKDAKFQILNDGRYRIIWQDGTVAYKDPEEIMNAVMKYIKSSDTLIPYLKQIQNYMGQNIFDEDGNLIPLVESSFININTGKRISYDEYKNLKPNEKKQYIRNIKTTDNILGNILGLSRHFGYRKEDLRTHFTDKKENLEILKYNLRRKEKKEEMERKALQLISPQMYATYTIDEIEVNLDKYLNLVKKDISKMSPEEYTQYSKLETMFGPVLQQDFKTFKELALSKDSPFQIGFKSKLATVNDFNDLDQSTKKEIISMILESKNPIWSSTKSVFKKNKYDIFSTNTNLIKKAKFYSKLNKKIELDRKLENLKNNPNVIQPSLLLAPENELGKLLINGVETIIKSQDPATFVRGIRPLTFEGKEANSDKIAWDTKFFGKGIVKSSPTRELLDKLDMSFREAVESGILIPKVSFEGNRMLVHYNVSSNKLKEYGVDVGDSYFPKEGYTEVYNNVDSDALMGYLANNTTMTNPDLVEYVKRGSDWIYGSIDTMVDKALSDVETKITSGLKSDKDYTSRAFSLPKSNKANLRVRIATDEYGDIKGYNLLIYDDGIKQWIPYKDNSGNTLFRNPKDIKEFLYKLYK